jgi:hypothetical protein
MTDTDALRAALFSFHDRLAGLDIEWAVTASMNLALQGLAVTPNDIDVLTDADGTYRIEELFAEHVVRPIKSPEIATKTDEGLRSHYGALSLDGIEVELMGNVEHRIDGEWVPIDDVATHREFIEREGRDIPIMPLDHELTGYRDLGRTERVALLEAHMEREEKKVEEEIGGGDV